MTTRIQCSFVNPPKPGKTNGSIRVKTGEFYGVKPDMLNQFQPEQTYDIEFTSRQFNGQTYNTITSAKHLVEAAPAAANGAGSSYGKYGKADDATAERIFVCGGLNAAISGGHVDLNTEHLTNLVNIFRLVWDDTFGAGEKPKDDMQGDGIPY